MKSLDACVSLRRCHCTPVTGCRRRKIDTWWLRLLKAWGIETKRACSDQGVAGSECGGVRGVLEESPLAIEATDIEREAGGREQNRDREGEDHEDLATLVTAWPAERGDVPARAHQLRTIVTSPVRLNRPPASCGRNVEIRGITRSW